MTPGELLDRLTILELKVARARSVAEVRRPTRDLERARRALRAAGLGGAALRPLVRRLRVINGRLWRLEDQLRRCERTGSFGARFVVLARGVYLSNDRRAALKRAIDAACGLDLGVDKIYRR